MAWEESLPPWKTWRQKYFKILQLIDLLGGAGRGLDAGVVGWGAGGLEEGGQLHLHQRARGQALYPPIYSIKKINDIISVAEPKLFLSAPASRKSELRLRL